MIINTTTFLKAMNYDIQPWKLSDVPEIFALEQLNWAPWLQKPEKNFRTIATNFPNLQRLIRDEKGKIIATVTTNRITWDGNPDTLSTWDGISGGSMGESDHVKTYTLDGNTLGLMSMNVDPTLRGQGLAPILIEEVKKMAKELNIKHIVSSLRPYKYGDYKLEIKRIPFEQYCQLKTSQGEPYDPWLRSVSRQHMIPLRATDNSIVVTVNKDTFKHYQTIYHQKKWKQVEDGIWECGETGSWFKNEGTDTYTYTEKNLSVEIPIYETLHEQNSRSSFQQFFITPTL